jgi:hypothetical protein
MNPLVIRVFAVLTAFFAASHTAFGGPFHTRIISATGEPVTITVPGNVFLQIRNFTQEGGSARGTVMATINGETANVVAASQITTATTTPVEFINRVVVAGPAIVTVEPVPGATLTITYRKVREAEPLLEPTPTATPTATPTPTP